jgi:hypothetical protein
MTKYDFREYCNDDLEFTYNGTDYMADVVAIIFENEFGQEWVETSVVLFYVGTPDEWVPTELTEELEKVLEDKILEDFHK